MFSDESSLLLFDTTDSQNTNKKHKTTTKHQTNTNPTPKQTSDYRVSDFQEQLEIAKKK